MAALNAKIDQSTWKSKAIVWTLTTSDTGVAVDISDLDDITVQVTSGGAGTAQIEVSNDNANFVGLTAALALGTPAPMVVGMQFLPVGFCPRFIRPNAVAAASVVVTITGKKRINAV
jgi:hypothetical protein